MGESPATSPTGRSAADLDRSAGRYLTFRLGGEIYALPIAKVREIVGMQPITRVPESDPCIAGVTNLRGRIVAVQDLRRKFAMPAAAWTEETCLIVVEGAGLTNGVIVDRVEDVADLTPADLEPAPKPGNPAKPGYIAAMGKAGGRVVILLDSDRLLRTRGMRDEADS